MIKNYKKRINITLVRGFDEELETWAQELGYKSKSELIATLICSRKKIAGKVDLSYNGELGQRAQALFETIDRIL